MLIPWFGFGWVWVGGCLGSSKVKDWPKLSKINVYGIKYEIGVSNLLFWLRYIRRLRKLCRLVKQKYEEGYFAKIDRQFLKV